MLKLIDILGIPESEYKNYKIHFAIGSKRKIEPYEQFLINKFKTWQEQQTRKNFSRPYVISLIYAGKDTWLYAGVYKILSTAPLPITNNSWKGWKYESELTDIQADLIGRAFVYYKKEYRASYPKLELQCENSIPPADMEIVRLLDKRVSIADFNGFDKTIISYETLKSIIDNEVPSWQSALSNVKGVYLIVDRSTGKQYVGSAYGEQCIWQRWSNYAHDGHGGNEELKALLSKNGTNYKYNFQYSILEICNMNIGNEYILTRENHWKEVLLSREFGLNKN